MEYIVEVEVSEKVMGTRFWWGVRCCGEGG